MSDDEFLAAFEAATLPNGSFHHRDHVRAGWLILQRLPLLPALARFTAALQRFAAANGAPQLYHATITAAFLLLIHERAAAAPEGTTFEAFAAANPDLLRWKPSILADYYSDEALGSVEARRGFVVPDRVLQRAS